MHVKTRKHTLTWEYIQQSSVGLRSTGATRRKSSQVSP